MPVFYWGCVRIQRPIIVCRLGSPAATSASRPCNGPRVTDVVAQGAVISA